MKVGKKRVSVHGQTPIIVPTFIRTPPCAVPFAFAFMRTVSIILSHADFIEGESSCLDDVDNTDVYFDGITHTPAHDEPFFCDPCKRDRSLMRDGGTHMAWALCHTNTDRAHKALKNSNAWANTSCSLAEKRSPMILPGGHLSFSA